MRGLNEKRGTAEDRKYSGKKMFARLPPETEQELARRTLMRRNLLYFTKQTQVNYLSGWVHEDICRRLQKFSLDVINKKSPRLMLLVPPRHGKSTLASVSFPAWHLGHCPQHEIINVGYNLDLPMEFSRKVRNLVRDPLYTAVFGKTVIATDSQAIENWKLIAGGGFTAAGVGGGITGRGAHVLVIDDPLKNQQEADNVNTRTQLWDWYLSTAYTRLAPGGGMLLIECMTGDTPVLMADGTERRLEAVRVGDAVATYEDGRLSSTIVAGWKSSGRDRVFTITTNSGKMVRANGRHPFLVSIDGEIKWVRTRSLSTGHKIVTLKGSEGSGKGKYAPRQGAAKQSYAVGFARRTTAKRSGPTGLVRHLLATFVDAGRRISSAGTELRLMISNVWRRTRAACAQPVTQILQMSSPFIGSTDYALITATTPSESEGCYATAATSQLGSSAPSGPLSPWPRTSDFTLDPVVSVVETGDEEVFDLRIDRTENFIANGLVSHNTWWNDDDLAGRLMEQAKADPLADQFEVIKYPALAEQLEVREKATGEVRSYDCPDADVATMRAAAVDTETHEIVRRPGDALHPARYPREALEKMRASMTKRIWSALYQQNPVPEDGSFFTKDMLKTQTLMPGKEAGYVYTAWDFAITEKQTADWNVGTTVVHDDNDVMNVVEVSRFRGDAYMIVEEILNAAERWSGPGTPYVIGVEDGMIWRSIEPVLKRRMQERGVYVSYEPLRPLTDKLARARPLQARLQSGRVVFSATAPWLQVALNELLRFPAGVHDDIVDSMAWAAHLCAAHQPPAKPVPPKVPSWKDALSGSMSGGSHMVS